LVLLVPAAHPALRLALLLSLLWLGATPTLAQCPTPDPKYAGLQTLVQAIYLGYFGRPVDPAERAKGVALLLRTGGTLQAIDAALRQSPEFDANRRRLSPQAQLDRLFENLFGRDATSEEQARHLPPSTAKRLNLAQITYKAVIDLDAQRN